MEQLSAIPANEKVEVSYLKSGEKTHIVTSKGNRSEWIIYRVQKSGKLDKLFTGNSPAEVEGKVFDEDGK